MVLIASRRDTVIDYATQVAELVEKGLPQTAIDADFAELLSIFRATGGISRTDDLTRLLADHPCGEYVSLARLIVAGEVFYFERNDALWVPMFQFDLRDLSLNGHLSPVLDELPKLDGWTVARWFSKPNPWLQDRRPVDALMAHPDAVVRAARAFAIGPIRPEGRPTR